MRNAERRPDPNILKPNPVSSTQFYWSKESGSFCADMSEVGGFGRVYGDACDEGFTLVSRYDGREVTFVVEHEERDIDNDVRWWTLKPADRYERQELGFTVTVWNS